MWTYRQTTGALTQDGVQIGRGYSGAGLTLSEGRNNPAMETVRGKGPIPVGLWKIHPPRHSRRVGPLAMDLTPVGHEAHGRTAFMIHGDNRQGDASRGCIILAPGLRRRISESGDAELEVVR